MSAPQRKAIYIIPSGRHMPAAGFYGAEALRGGNAWPQEVVRRPMVAARVVQRPVPVIGHQVRRCIKAPPPQAIPQQQRKRKAPPAEHHDDSDDDEEQLDLGEVYELLGQSAEELTFAQPPVPRKRERLTNLSPEEKLNRRKLKNRVAAQTARDRKKERSGKLEQVVRALLAETKRLRAENKGLRAENQRLAPYGHQQQQQWGYAPASEAESALAVADVAVEKDSFKSAALISGPLPRERESNAAAMPAASQPPARRLSKALLRTLICSILTTICAASSSAATTTSSGARAAAPASPSCRPSSRTSSKAPTPLRSTSTSFATRLSRRRLLLRRCLAIIRQHYKGQAVAPWEWTRTPTARARADTIGQPTHRRAG